MIDRFCGVERWELRGQVGDGELVKMDRLRNILQTPFPHVPELCVFRTLVADQISRNLREQDLSTMPGRHDPLGHGDGGIAGIAWRPGWILQLRRARVKSH